MIPVLEPRLTGNELQYVTECINSNWISSKGKFVEQFENSFEERIPGYQALAVSNGTVALHLALVALGVGQGDEVIVPDLTFAASINAVLYCGATPVLVDVNSETCVLDTESVQRAICPKTRAIIAVHLYGFPCDMERLRQIADESGVYIIEDAAEALGSKYKGTPVGGFGEAATFSFFGNKTITTGEGGMVLFRDSEVADQARTLRDHGMSKERRYWHDVIGYNYRMTNLQAAVGVAQMESLDAIVDRKRAIAEKYTSAFKNINGVKTPAEFNNIFNSYWLYWIRLDPSVVTKGLLSKKLMDAGIETRPFFYPLHIQPPYLNVKKAEELKSASLLAKTGLCLPTAATLSEDDQDRVITEVIKVMRKHN